MRAEFLITVKRFLKLASSYALSITRFMNIPMVTVWRHFLLFQNKLTTWWRKKKRNAWRQTLKFKWRKGNTRHFPKKTESTSVEFVGKFSDIVRVSCSTRWYTREKSHTYVMCAANHLTASGRLKRTRWHTLERSRGYVMSAVNHLTENGILNYTLEHTPGRGHTSARCVRKPSVTDQTLYDINGYTPERSLTLATFVRRPSVKDPTLWTIIGHTLERSLTVAACAKRPSVKDPTLWNINGHTRAPERTHRNVISVKRHLVDGTIFYNIIGSTPERWPADQCDTCEKTCRLKSLLVCHTNRKCSPHCFGETSLVTDVWSWAILQ